MTPPADVFRTIDDILRYAVGREEDAAALYTQLADRCTKPIMRLTFLEFAAEERAHRAILEDLLASGRPLLPSEEPVESLGIAPYVPDVKASTDMELREAFQLAMTEEKKAFLIYWKLAEAARNRPVLHQTFLGLAQQEARHKLHFEVEYELLTFEEA